jgi:hypothetical protein
MHPVLSAEAAKEANKEDNETCPRRKHQPYQPKHRERIATADDADKHEAANNDYGADDGPQKALAKLALNKHCHRQREATE